MIKTRKPRVLMLTATLGYGGAESDLLRLAKYLSSMAEVTIALMAREYGSIDYSSAQSDTDLPTVILDKDGNCQRNLLEKVLRWGRMLRHLRLLKREHDVTISFLSGPNLLNALTCASGRTIVSERGSKLHHVGIPAPTKWLWLRLLDPFTYRCADIIVPASVDYMQEVATIAGSRNAHKIIPIEGGIDAADLISKTEDPIDSDIARFCAGGATAVYCGRLDKGKGIDLLIPAFAAVHCQLPEARFLIIGDGPLHLVLRNLCEVAGLSVTEDGDPNAAVFIAGYRSNPMRHYRLCRVFLFPSLHEGLPNALIEGVASGIPIIASDCPWGPRSILAELGDDEAMCIGTPPLLVKHGMLMPLPNTPEGVAIWQMTMIKIMAQPYQRHSPEACYAAISRFDLNQTGAQWAELIHSITSLRLHTSKCK